MRRSVRVQEGGGGEPVLVLLHGLGAGLGHNAHVESPQLSVTLLDRWVTPAMPA